MNDERPFELLASHAGPVDLDPGFEDGLYVLLQREMGRSRRSSRAALLLVAALLLALLIGGAVLVGSGIVDPPVLPDGPTSRLAYGLDGDIYLADSDGGNPVRIADGSPESEAGCGSFWGSGSMWSPDGRYLAYRSEWDDVCSGSVFIDDAAGQPVASFPGGGWLVSWSPDSTSVTIGDYESVEIYGIDGVRQASLLLPSGCANAGDLDPVWSPDGESVVVPPCEVPIDGRTPQRLPADDPRSHDGRSFSPDGTRVAYSTLDSLVIADAGGSELLRVTPHGSDGAVGFVQHIDFAWSPSSDRVAFTWSPVDSDTGYPVVSAFELNVVDMASGAVTLIAAEPGIVPIGFSADGQEILYATHDDEYHGTGLWSRHVDGSDARLLVSGTDWGDWQPQVVGE